MDVRGTYYHEPCYISKAIHMSSSIPKHFKTFKKKNMFGGTVDQDDVRSYAFINTCAVCHGQLKSAPGMIYCTFCGHVTINDSDS